MTQIIVLVIDNFFNFKFNFWNLTLFGRLLKYIAIFWSQQVERLVFVGYSGDMREDIHQFVLRFVFHLFFFNSVQSLSRLWLFETQWTAPCQASLSITNSCSLLKLMSIESVMPSNHLILCCPLLPISLLKYFSNLFTSLHYYCHYLNQLPSFNLDHLNRFQVSILYWSSLLTNPFSTEQPE